MCLFKTFAAIELYMYLHKSLQISFKYSVHFDLDFGQYKVKFNIETANL